MKAIHVSAAESDSRKTVASWGSLAWVANQGLTGSAVTLGRMCLHPGESGGRHRHDNADEIIYLTAGSAVVEAGEESVALRAGDTLAIPAGLSHRIHNRGREEAEMILAYSSGSREYTPEQDS